MSRGKRVSQRPPLLAGLLLSGSDATARDTPPTALGTAAVLVYAVSGVAAVVGIFLLRELRPVFVCVLAVSVVMVRSSRKRAGGSRRSTTASGRQGAWRDEDRGASSVYSAEVPRENSREARASNSDAGPTPEQQRRRAELLHDSVLKKWRAYELDLALMIDYPAMSDPRVDQTATMIQAMRRAEDLRDGADIGAYSRAVREFEQAFEVAEAHARSLKRNSYSPAELKSLEKASALLSIAQDSVSTPPERRLAYQRLVREVQGLVLLPESATVALERRIQLELEADG